MEDTDNLAPMTFNMPRDWHFDFKTEAARNGISMKHLLMASFKSYRKEDRDGGSGRASTRSRSKHLDMLSAAQMLVTILDHLPTAQIVMECDADGLLKLQVSGPKPDQSQC